MQQQVSSLINGQWCERHSIHDRAFQFGDGCFTTLAIHNATPQLWQRHWQRLQHDCDRLRIPLPKSWQALLEAEITMLIAAHSVALSAVVKIIISRGEGGRGYAAGDNLEPQRILSISPFPTHYPHWQNEGVRLGWAQLQLAQQPALTGLKTLNRLEQILLKHELAEHSHVDDLLVCDSQGLLTETIVGNLFWRTQDTWFTPSLKNAGIRGVVRTEILANNPHVQEVAVPPETLFTAEEMFICNALMGLVPVVEVAGMGSRANLILANKRYPQQLNTYL